MAILFLWSVVSISMHNLKQPNSTACPNDMFKITAKTCYLVDVVCASSLNCYKRTIQLLSKTDQAESALKRCKILVWNLKIYQNFVFKKSL